MSPAVTPAAGRGEIPERITRFLRRQQLEERARTILPLTGDASDRRYFRVVFLDGESMVLALHAGPIEFRTLPFANVATLFEQVPLPVPAILGHADEDGVIAVEDLGDVTLQAQLNAIPPSDHPKLYRAAIALIELMQRRGAELTSDRYQPYRLAFDTEKLTWELDFFTRHFLEAHCGAALSIAEREILRQEWISIAEELSAEPRVLCHRDYHSRNLMVSDDRLRVIDFQDARLGPDTYDLASLLRDSYFELTDPGLDDLLDYFLSLTPGAKRAGFRRRFDLMSLQRNLKALGTFGNQATSRGNAAFNQYMPRTLRYVRENLNKYPRFLRLRQVLSAHIDELG